MSIKAWLEGESHDLECLAELFPYGSRDFWVDRQGSRYYLSAPDLDNPPDGVTHLKVAERLVATANGYARALYPDFRPVTSLGSFSEDGKPNFAQKEFTLEVRPDLSAGITATAPKPDAPFYDDLARKVTLTWRKLWLSWAAGMASWISGSFTTFVTSSHVPVR